MKVPIGMNELGLVKKGVNNNYLFYRNGETTYEREYNNKESIIMTFEEYKTKYPIDMGHIFYRCR